MLTILLMFNPHFQCKMLNHLETIAILEDDPSLNILPIGSCGATQSGASGLRAVSSSTIIEYHEIKYRHISKLYPI